MTAALLAFWLCLAVCVYIYFGYPALLWIVSRVKPRPVRAGDVHPMVTFVVAAYNEEKNIAAKIANTLALDYPGQRIELLVVSNGSTDRTNEIVNAYGDPRVQLVALPDPGKMAALNEGAARARGEILVFTDADFLLDRQTLATLVRPFADPEVGGVCGARNTAVQRAGDATGDGEGLYARWDRWQKIRESEIGSVFAADGLLYAVRKSLFTPIADPGQADDIAISARVVLQGYRLVFEPRATAYEHAVVEAASEFRRKIRVAGHSVRALLNLRAALFTRGFYSLELLSHKLIRHFIALFLIGLFVSNVFLAASSPFYRLTLAGQLAIYGLAVTGALVRDRPIGRARLLAIPYYFCFVNAAAFFGIVAVLRRHRTTAWSSRPTVG